MGIFCKDDGSGEKVIGRGKFVDGVFSVSYYNLDGTAYVGDIVLPACPPTVFVDSFPFLAGYSLQLLNADFVNNVVLIVERESDNAVQNYKFDLSGKIKFDDIVAFSLGGNVNVSSIHNQFQVGLGPHLSQVDASKRFRIVENGVLCTLNGKPCLKSNGASEMVATGSSSDFAALHSDISAFHVVGEISAVGTYLTTTLAAGPGFGMDEANIFATDNAAQTVYRNGYTSSGQFMAIANLDPQNVTPDQRIFSTINNGVIVNANSDANAPTLAASETDLIVGNWDNFQELVIYSATQNINNLKLNRNNVYGIW